MPAYLPVRQIGWREHGHAGRVNRRPQQETGDGCGLESFMVCGNLYTSRAIPLFAFVRNTLTRARGKRHGPASELGLRARFDGVMPRIHGYAPRGSLLRGHSTAGSFASSGRERTEGRTDNAGIAGSHRLHRTPRSPHPHPRMRQCLLESQAIPRFPGRHTTSRRPPGRIGSPGRRNPRPAKRRVGDHQALGDTGNRDEVGSCSNCISTGDCTSVI